MTELARRFLERFRGLDTAYGIYAFSGKHKGKKVDGKGETRRGQVTKHLWEQHLAGDVSIGVTPIMHDGHAYWGCVDIDDYSLDITALEAKIREAQLPLTLCRTKSGGAHLFLFTREPVEARTIRQKLGEWAVALGYPGVEIFPKQDQLGGEDDVGNWLNMPYFGGAGTERFALYNGLSLSPEDFLDLAAAREVDEHTLDMVQPVGGPISDGPPCLQTMALHGVPEGGRNEALFAFGVYVKEKHGDHWEEALNEVNQQYFMPPLGFKEVGDMAKSLGRKEYYYPCKKQPMASFCNKDICRQREFGIGSGDNADDPGVLIDQLTELKAETPIWFATINGVRVQLTTQDLQNQGRFATKCIEELRVFPNSLKPKKWQQLINKLLQEAEVIYAPEDSGPTGQFLHHLENFCTGRQQGKSREDILRGMPWPDPETGRTYFRSADLIKYLRQQQFREMRDHEIWSALRDHADVKHHQFNIKRKFTNVWSIPTPEEQEGEFEVPRKDSDEGSF